MPEPPRTASPPHGPFGDICISATADILAGSLRTMISISYVPLARVVARLDTTRSTWVLTLDTDSPVEDHCWVMVDVLRVLSRGAHAAENATRAPALTLVRDDCPAASGTGSSPGSRLPHSR
jgi:hypothetical protein